MLKQTKKGRVLMIYGADVIKQATIILNNEGYEVIGCQTEGEAMVQVQNHLEGSQPDPDISVILVHADLGRQSGRIVDGTEIAHKLAGLYDRKGHRERLPRFIFTGGYTVTPQEERAQQLTDTPIMGVLDKQGLLELVDSANEEFYSQRN